MPLSENPPQQPTSLVLHFTDLTPQAIAVLQALGFGGAGVGKPVTGAGANQVLFTDASGNLQVSSDFTYDPANTTQQLYLKKNPDPSSCCFVIESRPNDYYPTILKIKNLGYGTETFFVSGPNDNQLEIILNTLIIKEITTNEFAKIDLRTTSGIDRLLLQSNSQPTTRFIRINLAANHTADAMTVFDSSSNPMFRVLPSGGIAQNKTITPNGTTGNQTINKPLGTVNIAAGQSSVTVTNSLVDANSIVFAVVRTNDTTAQIKNVTCAAGSFTIRLAANATAETSIGFMVMN
jgi:hypothetical protein